MILDTIAASTKRRVEREKERIPFANIKDLALSLEKGCFSFEKALSNPEISYICEVKKASPSKGLISPDFPYLEIAKDYEAAGASAVSVLTEPEFFMGSSQYLKEIAETISIPVLRKDFIIDEYQIYEARLLGASAVLLICSLLSTETLTQYLHICDTLGLSALVEAHTEEELTSAMAARARVIGVNNRNLKTFQVDFDHAVRLRSLVPSSVIFVAESGIKTHEDITRLKAAGVNAVLIGETLMKASDKKQGLRLLAGE